MGLRIPPHLADTAKALGLRTWVDSKKFPVDDYFSAIRVFNSRLAHIAPDGDYDPAALAAIIAQMLHVEGALLTHVLDKVKAPIADEAEWSRYCLAAGWTVLQRYEREKGGVTEDE